MALKIVTDGKNDKPKKNYQNMYTTREHGMGHVSCVPLSFVFSKDQIKKNIQLNWQATDNADTGHGWQTWVTRWRELSKSLDVCDRNLAKLLLDT